MIFSGYQTYSDDMYGPLPILDRRDLGGVLEAYQEVAKRLGVLTENRPPKGAGPVLVSSNPGGKPN